MAHSTPGLPVHHQFLELRRQGNFRYWQEDYWKYKPWNLTSYGGRQDKSCDESEGNHGLRKGPLKIKEWSQWKLFNKQTSHFLNYGAVLCVNRMFCRGSFCFPFGWSPKDREENNRCYNEGLYHQCRTCKEGSNWFCDLKSTQLEYV